MTFNEVMIALESAGDERTKKTLMKHGAKEPFFGVKVADLKKILKKTKKDHELSLKLYATGNSDAMYLAGLMADETKITEEQLDQWASEAYWYYLSEYTVPWVAAETEMGFDIGQRWIQSDQERIASAGWATLASYCSVREDDTLDINRYSELLDTVEKDIQGAQNRVRNAMNNFVISVGTYIAPLTGKALQVGNNMGKVSVDVGDTACKVPVVADYIKKVINKDRVGVKRKACRC